MNFKKFKKNLGFILIIFFSFSCVPSLTPARKHQPDTASYQKTIQQWTRGSKLYNNWDTILIVDALYKTPAVRRSFVEQYARTAFLSSREKEKRLKEEFRKSKDKAQFLLAIYSGKDEWNTLEKKKSIWTLVLENEEGKQFRPSRIKEIKQEDLPLKNFYPFITPWKRVYEIEFSAGPALHNSRSLKLIISSLVGRIDLKWKRD